MDLVWHIPGQAQGRLIRVGLDGGLQATSYILARAASFLRENVKDKGPTLLMSGGSLGLAIQAAWDLDGQGPLFVAVASPAQGEKTRSLENGVVLDDSDPGFVDRLKMETRGEGFGTVLVASARAEAVRKALGAARVLGCVSLLSPTRASVRIDLHSTVNYKSLDVQGADVFSATSSPTDVEFRAARGMKTSHRPETIPDLLFRGTEEREADRFEVK